MEAIWMAVQAPWNGLTAPHNLAETLEASTLTWRNASAFPVVRSEITDPTPPDGQTLVT